MNVQFSLFMRNITVICVVLLSVPKMAEARRVDPNSQEAFWATIRSERTVETVDLRPEENSVNRPTSEGKWLKVVCISDTHEQLGGMLDDIPNGDILIHAGDFTNAGSKEKLLEFNAQLGKLPHKHKIIVAGNHDLGFDDVEDMSKRHPRYQGEGTIKGYELLTNCTYLHDKDVVIEGIKFYGSSWHPLAGYPFTLERGPLFAEKWTKIPLDTDVLITHTPPLGYLDKFSDEHWGEYDLLLTIESIKPQFHVFGHVHECYGAARNNATVFINAASCLKANQLGNKPIVFYIQAKL